MTPEQTKVRQAIESLRRHIPLQAGADHLDYALNLFDEMIARLQPNSHAELRKRIEPPTVLKERASTVDKLTGLFPEKRNRN